MHPQPELRPLGAELDAQPGPCALAIPKLEACLPPSTGTHERTSAREVVGLSSQLVRDIGAQAHVVREGGVEIERQLRAEPRSRRVPVDRMANLEGVRSVPTPWLRLPVGELPGEDAIVHAAERADVVRLEPGRLLPQVDVPQPVVAGELAVADPGHRAAERQTAWIDLEVRRVRALPVSAGRALEREYHSRVAADMGEPQVRGEIVRAAAPANASLDDPGERVARDDASQRRASVEVAMDGGENTA